MPPCCGVFGGFGQGMEDPGALVTTLTVNWVPGDRGAGFVPTAVAEGDALAVGGDAPALPVALA
ncbi:MAG: hypothetical protein OQK53_02090 [Rhodospirillales bacterium]|nr:hypothetical protein [Rhodospirillales bacterium]